MKIAYFSPLNPQPSGISDYSEELLPYLAAETDITLFVDGFQPTDAELRARFACLDYRRDPAVLRTLDEYDAVVYHMGNDHRYHSRMLEAARARPGIVVFHDFALQDFFLGLARARGRMDLYLEEVAACHGEEARREAAEALERGSVPSMFARPTDFPLNCRLAREAEAIIVHSEWSRARLAQSAPGVPIARIQMHVKPHAARSTPSIVDADAHAVVQIANFGLITPGKGIEKALRALSSLKADHDFHYTLVGEPNPFFDVRALVGEYGMEDRVTITGQVPLEEFERRIAATDIALNLRERTVGETSASLCRIMVAGVASIISNVGWYAELPGDAVIKIDADEYADAMLAAYLKRLIEDAPLRARIGANARRHMLAAHDIRQTAADYLAFLRETIEQRTRRHFLGSVGAEMAQLGIEAGDESMLREVATELAALVPAGVSVNASAAQATAIHSKTTAPLPLAQQLKSDAVSQPQGSEANDGNDDRSTAPGRLPKIEGIDYKRAAIEYPRKLDAERSHYLKTKPFYNLANKPPKHQGEGMDAETHRHFCDFANMAVALSLPAGRKILDVGCGSGWLSEYFARLGYDVTGIDISDDLISTARERVESIAYDVDHETPLRCRFLAHDIDNAPLSGEKFDAIICYDSLHHFEHEHAVIRHLAEMLAIGGVLFILEGNKPPAGSETEEELKDVMLLYETLESPFDLNYLLALLADAGFAVVGDYVSINGLCERAMWEDGRLSIEPPASNYLLCKKVSENAPASSVPDSRAPRLLAARISLRGAWAERVAPGAHLEASLSIENTGDTLWLTGQSVREGVVMPAVRVYDETLNLISEFHGQPLLPAPVAPGESVRIKIAYHAPRAHGSYTIKIDLVDQHICWFEERGSEPLVLRFEVR